MAAFLQKILKEIRLCFKWCKNKIGEYEVEGGVLETIGALLVLLLAGVCQKYRSLKEISMSV